MQVIEVSLVRNTNSIEVLSLVWFKAYLTSPGFTLLAGILWELYASIAARDGDEWPRAALWLHVKRVALSIQFTVDFLLDFKPLLFSHNLDNILRDHRVLVTLICG